MRILLLLVSTCFSLAAGAQLKTLPGDLYPFPKMAEKKYFREGNWEIFSGCVEGDCKNGKGTFITIDAEGIASTGKALDYVHNVNVIYYVNTGTFRKQGNEFEGTQTRVIVPFSRKTYTENYKADKPDQRVDLSKEGLRSGIFSRYYTDYRSEGLTQMPGLAAKYKFKNAIGWFNNGEMRYVAVEYNEGHPLQSFTGIVNDSLQPVYGVGTYRDGSVFNGFFLREGTGPGYFFSNRSKEEGTPRQGAEEFPFMPDLSLLHAIFIKPDERPVSDLAFRWDIKREESLGFIDNRMINFTPGRIEYGMGRYYDDAGRPVEKNYTGNGIYYASPEVFYFGGLKQGVPDGKGFLYHRYQTMNRVNNKEWPVQTHLRYGNFVNGFYTDGYFTFDNGETIARKKLEEAPIVEPGFADLVEKINVGNWDALKELADFYFNGRKVKQDIPKALAYYERAGIHGSLKALLRLGEMYENGDPSNGIAADSVKAVSYYRRGAELKPSPMATAEAIRNVTIKYFRTAYTYLTNEQAARYKLEDEYNMVSELARTVIDRAIRLEKEAAAAAAAAERTASAKRFTPDELPGKMFFKDTAYRVSSTKYIGATGIYQVESVTNDIATVSFFYTNNHSVRKAQLPVTYFTLASSAFRPAALKYHRCTTCNGSGFVTATTTFKHTNDYEYTLGKKITYTVTKTNSVVCDGCYGATICPTNGGPPEWPRRF